MSTTSSWKSYAKLYPYREAVIELLAIPVDILTNDKRVFTQTELDTNKNLVDMLYWELNSHNGFQYRQKCENPNICYDCNKSTMFIKGWHNKYLDNLLDKHFKEKHLSIFLPQYKQFCVKYGNSYYRLFITYNQVYHKDCEHIKLVINHIRAFVVDAIEEADFSYFSPSKFFEYDLCNNPNYYCVTEHRYNEEERKIRKANFTESIVFKNYTFYRIKRFYADTIFNSLNKQEIKCISYEYNDEYNEMSCDDLCCYISRTCWPNIYINIGQKLAEKHFAFLMYCFYQKDINLNLGTVFDIWSILQCDPYIENEEMSFRDKQDSLFNYLYKIL